MRLFSRSEIGRVDGAHRAYADAMTPIDTRRWLTGFFLFSWLGGWGSFGEFFRQRHDDSMLVELDADWWK
jgi:hypothetical protein